MKMFFVIAALLLFLTAVAANAEEECEAIPLTSADIEHEPMGYTTIVVVLPLDWGDIPSDKVIRYPITINMDPSKARYDSSTWIREVRKCLWWTEYTIVASREQEKFDGVWERWLETPLLLPDDEIGKVEVSTTIRGVHYRGEWYRPDQADPFALVFVAQEDLHF